MKSLFIKGQRRWLSFLYHGRRIKLNPISTFAITAPSMSILFKFHQL